jgi:hypothetical protein
MRSTLATTIVATLAAAAAARSQETPPEPGRFPFRDVVAEAGITFQQNSAPEKKYILPGYGRGA